MTLDGEVSLWECDLIWQEEEVSNLETQITEMSVVRDELHTLYQGALSQFQTEEQKFKEVESKMREKAEVGEPLKVKSDEKQKVKMKVKIF